MSLSEMSDRRQHPRQAVIRQCKVRDARTAAFAPGQTADVSAGGALIRVDRARPFGPGDELDLVVSWDDKPVISAKDMVRARVRRVTPIDHHHQAVALEFVLEAAAALAA